MENKIEKIDILDRLPIVEQLIQLINNLDCSENNRSFAINGTWGCGKSFIIEMLEDKLNKEEDSILIKFNAWEYDFYKEPLIAILSAIVEKLSSLFELKTLVKNVAKEVLKGSLSLLSNLLGNITKLAFGVDAISQIKKIAPEIKEIKSKKFIENNFDNNLILKNTILAIQNNLKNLGLKIIFVIDEIDRCLPDYAIKILERTHHIFNNLPNSITIYSIDKNQLEHLIKNFYGDQLKIQEYLDKFIEFSYDIPIGSFNDKFSILFTAYLNNFNILNQNMIDEFRNYVEFLMRYIEIRKRIQIIKKANLLHNLTIKEKCDLSIAYFEMICLVVFDFYKDETTNFLTNHFTPNNYNFLKGHAKECIGKIFEGVKIYKHISENLREGINISDINDIKSIVFLYLRKISRDDIFCSTDLSEKQKEEQLISQLQLNVEKIKYFYESKNLIR